MGLVRDFIALCLLVLLLLWVFVPFGAVWLLCYVVWFAEGWFTVFSARVLLLCVCSDCFV